MELGGLHITKLDPVQYCNVQKVFRDDMSAYASLKFYSMVQCSCKLYAEADYTKATFS